MSMIEKRITITEEQNDWVTRCLESGLYADESALIRSLIAERQSAFPESPEEIAWLRAALIEGENSGYSAKTAEEIVAEVRREILGDG